jgi:hypothetical protein
MPMHRATVLHLVALFAAGILVACGPLAKHADAPSSTTSVAVDHHCADLISQAQVQLAPVRGVWNCLEPRVQARYRGTGDEAVVASGFFLAPATLIGCDGAVCVYSLPLEATTAALAGTPETTMTVWLDGAGLVAYMAIPKPER